MATPETGAGGGAGQLNLFRLFVDAVVDYAIFTLDERGRITTWNEGARRIKGYEPSEIIGRHFSTFYPPGDIAAGKPDRGLLLAESEGHWEDEGWRLRKDGTRFWANVVITALRDPAGRLIGFGKVTRDMTERRAAEQERVRLIAREQAAKAAATAAQQAVRARDDFLSVAAHELKTPVTSALATVQMLRRRVSRSEVWSVPPQIEAALASLEEQNKKVARLIDQLLDTSRVQGGQLLVAPEEADLVQIVAAAVADARVREPGRTIGLTAPETLPAVVDALRLDQVLANLLDNACKYSPLDAPIEVELVPVGDDASRISVRDRGGGLPPERRTGLFSRFHRGHDASHQSGLGLGLYLSRQIVQQHHGTIEAEFPPDGGARIVVSLPRRPESAG